MRPAKVRYQLHFGPYRTPRFKVGSVVQDEIRGRVPIIGVSDSRIPWPLAMNWTKRAPIIYGRYTRHDEGADLGTFATNIRRGCRPGDGVTHI